MADFYAVLQITRDADQSTIHAAYQRLRMAYDPERLGDVSDELRQLAAERLGELERAYAILADETLRAAYDAGITDVVERALPKRLSPSLIISHYHRQLRKSVTMHLMLSRCCVIDVTCLVCGTVDYR